MSPRAFAERICRKLRAAGYQAFLVGGCVRDILLGHEPADYDVCTAATPEQVLRIFPRSLTVGAKFGVVIVVEDSQADTLPAGAGAASDPVAPVQVEVATFRSDIGYSDGRHPDSVVLAKSPEQDVKRRDFTINALLMNPETNEVLDFVGGREDLRAGIIRAIGDPVERFREDKLRMVRAVRFASRLHYEIEPKTFRAISGASS
jgi:poly(A) polymerase